MTRLLPLLALLCLACPLPAWADAPVLYSESLAIGVEDEIEIDLDDLDAIEIEPLAAPGNDGEIDLGVAEVFGERSLIPLLDDARAVTVIDAADFGEAVALGDVIERVPGVDVRNQGGLGQLSSVLVRGARSGQVLVLVDGQPLGVETPDLAMLPLGRITRIEVLRGPAAARFGMGALGGVINIITEQPGPADPTDINDKTPGYLPLNENRDVLWPVPSADNSIHGDWRMSAGGYSAGSFELELNDGGTQWFVSHLQARNNYDYRRSGGDWAVRRNNDVNRQSLWTAWRSGGTGYRLGFTHLDRGVPGSAEFPTLRARLTRDSLWWQATGGGWRTGLTADWQHFTDPDPVLNRGEIDTRTAQGHLEAAAGASAGGPDDYGVLVRADLSDGDDTGYHIRPGLDAFQAWRWRHGRLLLSADAGLTASGGEGLDPVGNLGVEYDLGRGSRAYASAGYAVRHPAFSELYYADTGGVRGNPDLDPERVYSYELGLGWSGDTVRCELAGFFSDYRNSIIWAPVSAYTVEAVNTGGAEVAGAEALADVMLSREWWWRTAATWLPHAEFDSGVPLTGRADSHVNSRLEYTACGWRGAFSADYTGDLPADLFGSLVISPRTVCGLEIMRETGRHAVGLSVNNLFDRQTRDGWNYPLPGREITISWTTSF